MFWWRGLCTLVVLMGLAQAQGFGIGFRGSAPVTEMTGLIASWEVDQDLELRAVLGGGLQVEGCWHLPRETYGGAYLGAGLGLRFDGTVFLSGLLGYRLELDERWRLFWEGGPGYRTVPSNLGPVFVHFSSGIQFKL